jgi:hypothetical protein
MKPISNFCFQFSTKKPHLHPREDLQRLLQHALLLARADEDVVRLGVGHHGASLRGACQILPLPISRSRF